MSDTTTRAELEELHRLIDQLPAGERGAARRFLEYLRDTATRKREYGMHVLTAEATGEMEYRQDSPLEDQPESPGGAPGYTTESGIQVRLARLAGKDPVLDSLAKAEPDDEPLTDEQLAGIDRARADVASGRTVSSQNLGPAFSE